MELGVLDWLHRQAARDDRLAKKILDELRRFLRSFAGFGEGFFRFSLRRGGFYGGDYLLIMCLFKF